MNFFNDGGFRLISDSEGHQGLTNTRTSLVNGENSGHTSCKLHKDGFFSMICS